MKIAFFSYEYPTETGGGGIGTYLYNCVQYFPQYGHKVVVFCGTSKSESFWENEHVYRIPSQNWVDFNNVLPLFFQDIHSDIIFEVAEGTDFMAGGIEIKRQFPQIPFVVRAHTANYITEQFLFRPLNLLEKLRFTLGAIKRGKLPVFPHPPLEENFYFEKEIIMGCDLVISPSISLAEKYKSMNWLNDYIYVPLPILADEKILKLANTREKVENIVYFGRLELRKGVHLLAKAIPSILKQFPEINFHFIGNASTSPIKGLKMDEYLKKKFAGISRVTIHPAVPPDKIADILDMGDLFVFPSLFDSFGLVCCEAMSAGKPVIGSILSEMKLIIKDGITGLLTNPLIKEDIAKKIIYMIQNYQQAKEMGEKGRDDIFKLFHPDLIIPEQILAYQKAIENKK